ncbi:LysR substrate-binding domain-containing protein [Janthinobacterium sp. PSPC3-1]|uniref:LysR family transcriptional regulator n=1 Tax=Janthinobacterium sp. PSPC3-1 TaxID=2804653 RepID=UPI003CF036FA
MQMQDVRLFLAVANAGSLSAAARQCETGPMHVSRRIAALEAELGARLFHRTTRAVALTDEGTAFLPHAMTLVETEDNARHALRPTPAQASGLLRITAPSVFRQAIVLPVLSRLLAQHPALRVDLDVSDRLVDIVGQGFDLALRVAPLLDSELVAKRITGNPRLICAAPAYLARHSQPATLAELLRHDCIVLQAVPLWPLMVDGTLQRVRVSARVTTSSVEAARAAALQGAGLAMLTYWDVYRQLADGSLTAVALDDAAMEQLSIWAVMPTRRHVPARVKLFLAALEEALAGLL